MDEHQTSALSGDQALATPLVDVRVGEGEHSVVGAKIVLAGGGSSGGHSASLVAFVQELRKRGGVRPELLWVGSRRGTEREWASDLGVRFVSIPTGKLRRYISFRNIWDVVKLPFGVLVGLIVLLRFRPDVVFCSGGYVSVPTAVAAWMLRIPIVLHENDVQPGLANRIISRFARKVLVANQESVDGFFGVEVSVVGMPLRGDILDGDEEAGRKMFGFDTDSPVLLVIGGAQGAGQINAAMLKAAKELVGMTQVIHVSGRSHFEEFERDLNTTLTAEEQSRYQVVSYIGEGLRDVYACVDAAVTRGSAHVLNELLYYGVPMVVVPMTEYSSGHQVANARRISRGGAGIVLETENLSGEEIVRAVSQVFGERATMSEKARGLFVGGAEKRIVDEVLKLVRQS